MTTQPGQAPAVSIDPEEMEESTGAPIDQNLLIKAAKFIVFDYQGKGAPSVGAMLTYVQDEGTETTQFYSVASVESRRFAPATDGKTLIPTGSTGKISKSCNFHILMREMANAGFPRDRLTGDVSVLNGLYAYYVGVPEPTRSGLQRTAEQAAVRRVIVAPARIHNLPWEPKVAAPAVDVGTPATATSAVAPPTPVPDPNLAAAVEFVGRVVADGPKTRGQIAAALFTVDSMASIAERVAPEIGPGRPNAGATRDTLEAIQVIDATHMSHVDVTTGMDVPRNPVPGAIEAFLRRNVADGAVVVE